MSRVLHGSTALFATTVVVPAVLTLWALVTVAGIGLGGYALLHAGALEPSTLRTASSIGFALGCALAAGTVRLATSRTPPVAGQESYPVAGTLLGLSAIAGLCTLASLPHSQFFPYPLTTIAVVAAATYLALAGLLASVRVTIAVTRVARNAAIGGRYRAGFLTATFLLSSAGAVLFLAGPTPEVVLDAAADEIDLDDVRGPHGALDVVPVALCLGAGEMDHGEARDDATAPACAGLPDAKERLSQECLNGLIENKYDALVSALRRDYACGPDCDGIATDAALETCTKDPPANDPNGYFWKVAIHDAARQGTRGRRFSDEDLDALPGDPCRWSYNESHDERVRRFYLEVLRGMRPFEREVFKLRLRGLSHREVGRRLGITETKARDTYNNELRRLRRAARDWGRGCNSVTSRALTK